MCQVDQHVFVPNLACFNKKSIEFIPSSNSEESDELNTMNFDDTESDNEECYRLSKNVIT